MIQEFKAYFSLSNESWSFLVGLGVWEIELEVLSARRC